MKTDRLNQQHIQYKRIYLSTRKTALSLNISQVNIEIIMFYQSKIIITHSYFSSHYSLFRFLVLFGISTV